MVLAAEEEEATARVPLVMASRAARAGEAAGWGAMGMVARMAARKGEGDSLAVSVAPAAGNTCCM